LGKERENHSRRETTKISQKGKCYRNTSPGGRAKSSQPGERGGVACIKREKSEKERGLHRGGKKNELPPLTHVTIERKEKENVLAVLNLSEEGNYCQNRRCRSVSSQIPWGKGTSDENRRGRGRVLFLFDPRNAAGLRLDISDHAREEGRAEVFPGETRLAGK